MCFFMLLLCTINQIPDDLNNQMIALLIKSVETKVTTTCVPNEQRWYKNQLRFDIQMRLEY